VRLPVVSASDLIKALEKEGFVVIRQRGSHVVLQKKIPGSTVTTVVPNHKELAPGTLRSILKRSGISLETLVKLLTLVLGVTPRFFI